MDDKITFSDLVEKISEEIGATKQLVHDTLIETVHETRDGLERDGHVHILGLGRFRLKWHEARAGRNPQTGEEIEIPAHSTVQYKAEAELREFINRKYAHLKAKVLDEPVPADFDETTVVDEDDDDDEEEATVQPVATVVESEDSTVEEPPADKDEESKKSRKWWWLILLIIIIILAIIFWPRGESSDQATEEPAATEQAEEVTPAEDAEDTQAATDVATETPETEETTETTPTSTGTPGGSHSVEPGDNLWSLSNDFYNTSFLWPNIYRVNRAEISNPDVLIVGGNIDVPPLEGHADGLTAQDKDQIAEGFIHAYITYKSLGNPKAIDYLWTVRKWNVEHVIEKYRDNIDASDLELVDKIEGTPRVK